MINYDSLGKNKTELAKLDLMAAIVYKKYDGNFTPKQLKEYLNNPPIEPKLQESKRYEQFQQKGDYMEFMNEKPEDFYKRYSFGGDLGKLWLNSLEDSTIGRFGLDFYKPKNFSSDTMAGINQGFAGMNGAINKGVQSIADGLVPGLGTAINSVGQGISNTQFKKYGGNMYQGGGQVSTEERMSKLGGKWRGSKWVQNGMEYATPEEAMVRISYGLDKTNNDESIFSKAINTAAGGITFLAVMFTSGETFIPP